jgi:hypothetical protein
MEDCQIFLCYTFSAMKYAVIAVLFTVMQASPPIPRQTPNNAAQTTTNIQSNATPNQTKSPPAPSPLKTDADGVAQSNSGQQGSEDGEHAVGISKLSPVSVTRDWADWGFWIFSLLLVVVGGLQVWLLLGTMRTIQRQTELLERQINKERARIRIELKSFKPEQPYPGEVEMVQTIKYTVAFYGSTYAFVNEDTFDVELSDSPEVGDGQVKRIPHGSDPSKVVSPGTPPDDRLEPFVTTQFEIDSLIHGKSFVHFRGRITYRDFAEIERETTVCCVWKSWGPRKGKLPAILSGSGHWVKSGPPEANRET